MELYTGTVIGKWTLQSKLGSGIDGQVWSVYNASDDIWRAMKMCPPSANFYQEYAFLRSIDVPGVIPVYEYNTVGEMVYYIMDLADGQPFVEHLKAIHKSEQYDECIHLLISITRILSDLHTRGLMHLDIKSDNILVSPEGNITLIDFGKIGFVGDHSAHRKGSHQTMSPEQRSHWHLTPKSDVYSLAVMVYQALMDTDPPFANIGQVWPSLLQFNDDVEQSFAGLMQQCLHIVPSQRPSMLELHEAICEIQTNTHRAESFTQSENYIGQCPSLNRANALVVGMIGSGRRRIIHENIREAYLDGIPTFISTSKPLQPFSVWKEIVHTLLQQFSLTQRSQILQGVEAEISSLLPQSLSHHTPATRQHSNKELARAINIVLSRCAPVIVIVLQMDSADVGSLEIAEYLWTHPIPDVTLWGTSLHPFTWSNTVSPPTWSADKDERLMKALLPQSVKHRRSFPGQNPLQTCIKAWHLIANNRKEPKMVEGISSKEMWTLGLLKEPFPRKLADVLHPNIEGLIQRGVLESDPSSKVLRFAFLPFRWMVQQGLLLKEQYTNTHLSLVEAWSMMGDSTSIREQIYHLLLSGEIAPKHLAQVLWLAIIDFNYSQIDKWYTLATLHGIKSNNANHLLAGALLITNSKQQPQIIDALEQQHLSEQQRLVLEYIRFKMDILCHNYTSAINRANPILSEPNPSLPKVQLNMYIDLATMYLDNADGQNGIRICQHAMGLPIIEKSPQVSFHIQYLLARGFQESHQFREALQTATQALHQVSTFNPLYINLLYTLGLTQYALGKRVAARKVWNQSRQFITQFEQHPLRIDLEMRSIQLELEAGKSKYQQHRLKDCLSRIVPMKAHHSAELLGSVQALCWDMATQLASSRWVKRGFTLGNKPLSDRAKVSLARWYWLIGDLQSGWQLLTTSNFDYDGLLVSVEQVRFGILLGHFDWAVEQGQLLMNASSLEPFSDLQLLLSMCLECVSYNTEASLLESLIQEEHEWTEVNLGGLHMLAMRKRLRSESNCDTLDVLKRRAQSLDHKLYLALSNPSLYSS